MKKIFSEAEVEVTPISVRDILTFTIDYPDEEYPDDPVQ